MLKVSVWSGDEFDCEIYLKFNQGQAELLPKNLMKRNQFSKIIWMEYTVYVHPGFIFLSLRFHAVYLCVCTRGSGESGTIRESPLLDYSNITFQSICLSLSRSVHLN